jgi:hypothetical protein
MCLKIFDSLFGQVLATLSGLRRDSAVAAPGALVSSALAMERVRDEGGILSASKSAIKRCSYSRTGCIHLSVAYQINAFV